MYKYIMDIETSPQKSLVETCEKNIKPKATLKDPDKIKADIESKKQGLKKTMSVDPDYNEILCIGIKTIGKDDAKLYKLEEMEEWFKDKHFINEIDENKLPVHGFEFITFNGKSFDIPTIIKTGIKNNLDFPYTLLREMCKKWNAKQHIDLMEVLSFNSNAKSLDTLLQIYCGISKTPIDFETATEKEIKEHCLEDLKNTELLYNKFKNIF